MGSSTRCADAGPTPGSSCRTRKPATRSRGFSTKRSSASRSLTCAVSRNLRPPNFTKGMLRRVSSISSGPLWLRGAEQHRLLLQRCADLPVLQHPLDDVAGLVGLVAHADQAGRSADWRSVQRFLVKRSAARPITPLAAARIGWVER